MLHPSKCARILEQIVAIAKPRRVLVFGSAVLGKKRADDLDFLIVVADTSKTRDLARELYRTIHRSGISIDLIVVTELEYSLECNSFWSVIAEAHREGKEIYVA